MEGTIVMENKDKKDDKSTWAIGGGLLIGLGVGFFFLKASALVFVGCIIAGLGLGLMTTAIISSKKQKQ
jgi:Na+/melibiose symporter-like transporter